MTKFTIIGHLFHQIHIFQASNSWEYLDKKVDFCPSVKHEEQRVVYEVMAYGVPFEDLSSLEYLSEFSTSETKIQVSIQSNKHWRIQINIVALLDQLGQSSAETIIACDL